MRLCFRARSRRQRPLRGGNGGIPGRCRRLHGLGGPCQHLAKPERLSAVFDSSLGHLDRGYSGGSPAAAPPDGPIAFVQVARAHHAVLGPRRLAGAVSWWQLLWGAASPWRERLAAASPDAERPLVAGFPHSSGVSRETCARRRHPIPRAQIPPLPRVTLDPSRGTRPEVTVGAHPGNPIFGGHGRGSDQVDR